MEEDIQSLKDMLIPVMNRSNKLIQMVMEQRMQESGFGLTIKQYILLHRVSEMERPQSELAMITNRDKGSLTRLIQSLEKKGFVTRKVSKTDSRMNLVKITAKGRRVLTKASSVVKQAFEEITADLSKKERTAFIKTSSKLKDRACILLETKRN